MRKSRGEKVFEAGTRQGRVRTIRERGHACRKVFSPPQIYEDGNSFFKACLRNEFRAFSEHSLLPLPRYIKRSWKGCSLSTMIDRRSCNENNIFLETNVSFLFYPPIFFKRRFFTNLFIFLTSRDTVSRFPQFFIVLNILIKSETICITW